MTLDGEPQFHLFLMCILQVKAFESLERQSILFVKVVELFFNFLNWIAACMLLVIFIDVGIVT
jgi:hypothetical protein